MKLFIPKLKSEIKLTTAWTFDLHHEHRNKTLFELLKLPFTDSWGNWGKPTPVPTQVKLPKGTVLVLERIYIRNGAEEFDSLTFRIKQLPNPPKTGKKTARFWAKLDECNGMNIQIVSKEAEE